MGKRRAVSLPEAVVAQCLQKLPMAAMQKNTIIEYGNTNFKRAPTWCELPPYVATLRLLLDRSKGKQVKQVSMIAGALRRMHVGHRPQ